MSALPFYSRPAFRLILIMLFVWLVLPSLHAQEINEDLGWIEGESPSDVELAILDEEDFEMNTTETEEATEEADAVFRIEEYDEVFAIGKEVAFEGMRMAFVGSAESILLIEDNLDPVIYLRFERFHLQKVQMAVFDESGQQIMKVQKANLRVGDELSIMHDDWSAGTYTLYLQTSNGDKWKK
ncbi:MAG: hypothetical protein AAGM67_05455, partial [Bacteroidota bacterium]